KRPVTPTSDPLVDARDSNKIKSDHITYQPQNLNISSNLQEDKSQSVKPINFKVKKSLKKIQKKWR
ncbi:MAG: hypothetical protein Q8807_00375, partial ['Waltheria sp.' little leaf phytoplasma]|nr:hypothetical protein ['Waltheria sp.' little leaf phytoplasma]